MGTEIANLEAFKGQKPSQAFAALDPQKDSLADGIGSSYGVIGYKGKALTLRYRGEKYTFVRPDDGTPINYLDVVFLRQPAVKSKSYYAEGFSNDASDGKRPTCSSLNGITPDPDAQIKQSEACAICPRNVWKTDSNGRKGRECTDYKRLAVLILPKQTQQAMGAPLLEPVFLRVPPASLNDLALLGETMSRQGWHYSTYITRISFAPDKSHPQFVFRPLQKLSDTEAAVVMQLREDIMSLRITGEDQTPLLQHQPAAPAQQPAPVQQPVQRPAATPTAPTQAPPPVTAPSTVQPTAPQAKQADVVEGQFEETGIVMPAKASPPAKAPTPAAAPPQQTVADTGIPEEADADLDAKIKALMEAN